MDIFNRDWIPDKDMGVEDSSDAVKVIQFGGGVVQLIPLRAGSPLKVYSLTFTRKPVTIKAIEDFLNQHTGKRFLWEPPLENRQIIVIHSDKSIKKTGFEDVLSVKFTEVAI